MALTAEEHRNLVKAYNIHFDGPRPPSSWPDQYAEIFRIIYDIKGLRYEDYKASERRGMLAVAEMKNRVARLNHIAQICRDQRENEATWRGLTEPEIVSRFAAEVRCGICQKRLWDSEFKAVPYDPVQARSLQDTRAHRMFCHCSLEDKAMADKAMEDIDDSDQPYLFLSRFQTRFVHDPADRLKEKGLGSKEPDRVFGLRDTNVFKQQAATLGGLRRSPFKDGKVLYPFLIVEAKSEKGSRGFDSIENQTAFPIRTLLKLQHDLGATSENEINPLVWFLANQGEEWRVYGSILDDSKWRVIDLWHGSLLARDTTLQLLLIMDYICDWARDIYRRDIIRCFKPGDVEMRDLTPAYTIISSQRDELPSLPHSPSLPTPRALGTDEPALIELSSDTGDDADMDDTFPIVTEYDDDTRISSSDPSEEDDNRLTTADSSIQQPLLRFSSTCGDPKPWSRRATIRHSNMVLFIFRHFALPEEDEPLESWLDSFKAPEGSISLIQTLLGLIDRSNALTITMNGILQLENLWTRTTHQPSSKNDNPILAWISFRSYYQPGDWQVVRELSCITISQPTIMNLATIAGVHRSLSLNDWEAHRCHCLITDAQSLRSFCGRESMVVATLALNLRLEEFVHGNDEVHFRWDKRLEDEANAVKVGGPWVSRSADPEVVLLTSRSIYRASDLVEELLPGTLVPHFLTPHLWVEASMSLKGVLLVRKPLLRSATGPQYCLMVFDEMDFEEEPRLGEMISQVVSSGDIYVGGLNGQLERVASISESERSMFELWANILRGTAPTDAEWPS